VSLSLCVSLSLSLSVYVYMCVCVCVCVCVFAPMFSAQSEQCSCIEICKQISKMPCVVYISQSYSSGAVVRTESQSTLGKLCNFLVDL
jgi:hypothetical protein